MGKDADYRVDIDLDVYNMARRFSTEENETQGVLYTRTDLDEGLSHVTVGGQSDAIFDGLIAILGRTEGLFAVMLDAVMSHAEDHNIDINTFFDEVPVEKPKRVYRKKAVKPEVKKRGRPKKQ